MSDPADETPGHDRSRVSSRRGSIAGAFVLWPLGVWLLMFEGQYVLGGVVVIAAALVLVLAAGGGWSSFWEGFMAWLYFWR